MPKNTSVPLVDTDQDRSCAVEYDTYAVLSMPAMQPENSSFSHLMVVNDETPKTMELSSEDKKLHEKFGFSEVQASLVSLDLAADSTG